MFPNPISPSTYVVTSPEILEAMKQGYKCHKIQKVILFPDKTTTLFRDYVLSNLRGKFTAEKGLTQEDLDVGHEYHTRLFGNLWKAIVLSECKHDDNRRQYHKLLLNSLSGTWGKKEQYEHVKKFKQGLVPDSIFDKFNQNKIRDLKCIHDFDGHSHAMYYENCPSQVTRGTNVSFIAFITSHARNHLHRHLKNINHADLLYCDSDSMHMVCRKGSPDPFQTSKLITAYFKLEHIGMLSLPRCTP